MRLHHDRGFHSYGQVLSLLFRGPDKTIKFKMLSGLRDLASGELKSQSFVEYIYDLFIQTKKTKRYEKT